jgi:hypothetical protein
MSNSILLSSCLFGSVYLISKSLELINKSIIDNKKTPSELIIINGLTFVVSGSIFISGFTLLSLSYFKSSRE